MCDMITGLVTVLFQEDFRSNFSLKKRRQEKKIKYFQNMLWKKSNFDINLK